MPARCRPSSLKPRLIPLLAALLLGAHLAACQSDASTRPASSSSETPANSPVVEQPVAPNITQDLSTQEVEALPQFAKSVAGYTYQRADGNRFAPGTGQMPDMDPLDIPLDGRPLWVVAVPEGSISYWVVALEDGRLQAFSVTGRTFTTVPISPPTTPAGMPPLIVLDDKGLRAVTGPESAGSPLTHPSLPGGAEQSLVAVTSDGELIQPGAQGSSLQLSALPDARILVDEKGRALLLTDRTADYDHGVLGDGLEAHSITLLETAPVLSVAARIDVSGEGVIEGIAPIWADLDGDGRREIIVTVSSAGQGARILAFDEVGDQAAAGPAIELSYRWRHQLAVAPFGPEGELELAAVMTPHIGGIVEFYRMIGQTLEIVARLDGMSSHRIGSRNLDMALAGDFNGDGQVELVVPDQPMTTLNGIQRSRDGASVIWTEPLGGLLLTNLASATLDDETLIMGAGTDLNLLRIWLP